MTTLTTHLGGQEVQDAPLPTKAVLSSLQAATVVVAGPHGAATAGNIIDGPNGIAVVGDGGRATACFGGAAVAFDTGHALCGALGVVVSVQTTPNPGGLGLAAGGDGSVAVAGQRARAASGNGGISIARSDGLVYGGYDALLIIDTGRMDAERFVVGRTRCVAKQEPDDEGVLEPNTFYRWDGAMGFLPVDRPLDLKSGPPHPALPVQDFGS